MTRTELIQTINTQINANGSKSITGTVLRDVLLNIVNRSYYEVDGDDLRSLYGDPILNQLTIDGVNADGSNNITYAYTIAYNMGNSLLLEPVKVIVSITTAMSNSNSSVILPLTSKITRESSNIHTYVFGAVSNVYVDLLACRIKMYFD